MIKSTVLIQTMLVCLLPLALKGFNSSLSFAPDFPGGKVNQERALTEAPYRIKTIVIDAGHGGKDPGCSGSHSREKHIALSVSLKLAEAVRSKFPDIQVILTRDQDVFIPLHQRAAIANRASADLFISIHCNFLPGSAATRGTETYVMGLHTAEHNLNVAKRENASILLEEDYEQNYDYDPNSPEGHIMLSMFQNAYLENSILLAERFEAHAAQSAGRRSRGVKQAGFVVLKETTMPSILAEIGFLSNAREESFLLSEAGQSEMVRALLLAFAEYKQMIENEALTLNAGDQVIASLPLDGKQLDSQTVAEGGPLVPVDEPAPEPTRVLVRQTNEAPAPRQAVVIRHPYGDEIEVTPTETAQPAGRPSPQPTQLVRKTGPATPPPAPVQDGDDELLYCVQLAASPKPLNTQHPRWTNIDQRIEVVREGAYYKYQIRHFADLATANKVRSRMQHQGFIDAFIAIYRNGERLSPTESKRILESAR